MSTVHLIGEVQSIANYDPSNGYHVVRLQTQPPVTHPLACFADTPLTVGQYIECSANLCQHPKYQNFLKIDTLSIHSLKSPRGMHLALLLGVIDGIDPLLAQHITSTFGDQTLDVLMTRPDELRVLLGDDCHRINTIRRALDNHPAICDVVDSLQVTYRLATRIHTHYGLDAQKVIRHNPYPALLPIHGIGFKTADRIAKTLGFSPIDPLRLHAGIDHVMRELEYQGHYGWPCEGVIEKAMALLEVDAGLIHNTLYEKYHQRQLIEVRTDHQHQPTTVFLASYFDIETQIASRISRLQAGFLKDQHLNLPALIEHAEQATQLTLAASQRQAIVAALTHKVSIITGGPGVGKTTVIKTLLHILNTQSTRVLLCAPTGRAAKRLSAATGQDAYTLHRALELFSPKQPPRFNAHQPLSVDRVIIDEASMIDLKMMNYLLQALPDHAALTVIGDPDQLPSVEHGKVLSDMLSAGTIHTAVLTDVFRQAHDSPIIDIAHQVRNGQFHTQPTHREAPLTPGFCWIETHSRSDTQHVVLKTLTNTLPQMGFDPIQDVQVLTSAKVNFLGTQSLNRALKTQLNPQASSLNETYGVNDKVMQTRNDYKKGVFNGDVGRVVTIDPHTARLCVQFDEDTVCYSPDEYALSGDRKLELAYATTIHKAQGSQYPVVVVVLCQTHPELLNRKLFYTAITRAQKQVVVISERRSLEQAVYTINGLRWTMLAQKLRQIWA